MPRLRVLEMFNSMVGEDIMTLNIAVGILVFLVGITLTASLAVNLHTQHLLKQCREMLDFCVDLSERENECETFRKEGTE